MSPAIISCAASATSGIPIDVVSTSPIGMSVSEASHRISSSISAWTFSRILRSAYPREARRPASTLGAHLRTMIPLESMKWER